MDLEIVKEEKNELLKVTEIRARLSFTGATPSKQQVVKALAAAMKAKAELIIVRHIRTDYGEQAADVRALIYADRASLEKLERKSMIKKNTFGKKDEKPAEAPAEEKLADVPVEAPKEESPKAEAVPKDEEPKQKPEEKEAKPAAPKAETKPEEKKEGTPEEPKAEEKPAEEAKPEDKPKEGDA